LNRADIIDDSGSGGASDTVVVGLADTTDCGNVVLDEVMLGKIFLS